MVGAGMAVMVVVVVGCTDDKTVGEVVAHSVVGEVVGCSEVGVVGAHSVEGVRTAEGLHTGHTGQLHNCVQGSSVELSVWTLMGRDHTPQEWNEGHHHEAASLRHV